MPERIGVVDLGSNTTRLIVVEYTSHHSFKLLDEVRESVRLAEGMSGDSQIQPAPFERAVATMRLFSRLCSSMGVNDVVPVATSAIRDAGNQAEVLSRIERESGFAFRVLSATEEAYYGYLGVANTLPLSDAFVIDIGGGSTQVTMMRGRRFVRSFSQPIGALRLTDRFVHSDPISSREFKALEQEAAERFADLEWLSTSEAPTLAGIGGTIRTLADIDQKMNAYPLALTHAYVFTQERLAAIVERLRSLTLLQREEIPGLNRDRADLILAGAVILHSVMRKGGFEQIMVSGQGLREGLFYERFLVGENPPLFSDMRGFSVQNLARNHGYDAIHAAKVRELSLSLFDQLAPLHGYGAWEREMLGYAATLHDIGLAIGYYDHHRHGAYLVLSTGLQGFAHRELAFLALLVRYHRKGEVTLGDFRPLFEPDDAERLSRLSALLRLSEFLERRKSQVIQSLRVEPGDPLRIIARTVGDADVEIWDANRSSGLFRKAFNCDVEIVQDV
ncbi:MAG TPA: Ppx/GppA phosphatase family protein [Roseiflexaceae bacterium]|nr:Ppx/GppA phosphatase family protein [Roseiflexaceae bacterium]